MLVGSKAMIHFSTNFNVDTTVEHFLNVFQDFYTATNENGEWENWLIGRPVRGALHKLNENKKVLD
jgi:hypothetical protein